MNAPNIYAIRQRARRTQEQFANALGIPPNTLRAGSSSGNGLRERLELCCD
jgi:DNA-binding transcriptional regulator YiaG